MRKSLALILTLSLPATAIADPDPAPPDEDVDVSPAPVPDSAPDDASSVDPTDGADDDDADSVAPAAEPAAAPASAASSPPPAATTAGVKATASSAPTAYPVALADRPLILPGGMSEVSIGFRMPTVSVDNAGNGGADQSIIDFTDMVVLDAYGRTSLGSVELSLGAGLVVKEVDDPSDELSALNHITVAGTAATSRDIAAYGRARLFNVTGNDKLLSFAGGAAIKRKLNDRIAVMGSGGALFTNVLFKDETEQPFWALDLHATGAVELNATPTLGLSAGVEIFLPLASNPGEDDPDSVSNLFLDPPTQFNLSAGMTYAVTPTFDITAMFGLHGDSTITQTSDRALSDGASEKVFVFGGQGRM